MDMSFEQQVRERAYQLWIAGGMADGHASEHWLDAERSMKNESAQAVVIITKAAKPSKVAGKAKTSKAKTSKAKTGEAKTGKRAAAKPAAAETMSPKTSAARKSASAQPAAH